jgi:hypothetical protein
MRILLWTLAAALSFSTLLIAADQTGTWKMNLRKSKVSSDVQSMTATVELVGPNTYRIVTETFPKEGPSRHNEVAVTYDGKPHQLKSGAIDVLTHPDPLTWKTVQTRDGKVGTELVITLSGDGKTRIYRSKIFKPDGQTVEELRYYERQ